MAPFFKIEIIKMVAQFALICFVVLLILAVGAMDYKDRILQHATAFDLAVLVFAALSLALIPFAFRVTDSRTSRTIFMSNFIFVISASGGLVLSLIFMLQNVSAGAILLSALLATLGWALTQRNMRKSAQKQHTFAILLQMRNSEVMQFHTINMWSKIPRDNFIDTGTLRQLVAQNASWKPKDNNPSDKAGFPAYRSLVWMANYYEFIAQGVLSGDLDMRIMRKTIRGQMCDFYCRAYHLIKQSQGASEDGKPKNLKFENIDELFAAWADEAEWTRISEAARLS